MEPDVSATVDAFDEAFSGTEKDAPEAPGQITDDPRQHFYHEKYWPLRG